MDEVVMKAALFTTAVFATVQPALAQNAITEHAARIALAAYVGTTPRNVALDFDKAGQLLAAKVNITYANGGGMSVRMNCSAGLPFLNETLFGPKTPQGQFGYTKTIRLSADGQAEVKQMDGNWNPMRNPNTTSVMVIFGKLCQPSLK
jgi:hypothetical protein